MSKKLKFSNNFCQIFPGRTTFSIFLEIQRSRYKPIGENMSFADLAVAKSLEHNRRYFLAMLSRPRQTKKQRLVLGWDMGIH